MSETYKRACPSMALGGGARKDHLFGEDKRSLCGKYLYGGGRTVKAEEQTEDDESLCKKCARKA